MMAKCRWWTCGGAVRTGCGSAIPWTCAGRRPGEGSHSQRCDEHERKRSRDGVKDDRSRGVPRKDPRTPAFVPKGRARCRIARTTGTSQPRSASDAAVLALSRRRNPCGLGGKDSRTGTNRQRRSPVVEAAPFSWTAWQTRCGTASRSTSTPRLRKE